LKTIFLFEKRKEKNNKDLGENLYEASEANSWVENVLEATLE